MKATCAGEARKGKGRCKEALRAVVKGSGRGTRGARVVARAGPRRLLGLPLDRAEVIAHVRDLGEGGLGVVQVGDVGPLERGQVRCQVPHTRQPVCPEKQAPRTILGVQRSPRTDELLVWRRRVPRLASNATVPRSSGESRSRSTCSRRDRARSGEVKRDRARSSEVGRGRGESGLRGARCCRWHSSSAESCDSTGAASRAAGGRGPSPS